MDRQTAHLRRSGIAIMGGLPWGTHFCQFYETRQELLEILVPYFKAGLEGNEYCMWMTSDPLGPKEAEQTIPDIIDSGAAGEDW